MVETDPSTDINMSEKKEPTVQLDIDHIIHVSVSPEEDGQVLRKIDMCVLPLMGLAYMLQYMDKTTIGYAAVLGILKDAHLEGNEYSWTSSIFYFGYLAWSYPASYLMVRFPIGKYLACSVGIWGAILMCHAACDSFSSLMAVRFLLGCAESAVTPGFGLIVGMFYTKKEQTIRQNAWSTGFCVGNLFSGLCAYGIGKIDSHLATWRLLFLIFGAVTTAYSIILLFFLPDAPATAPFLNTRQREVAVHRTLINKTGVMDERTYKKNQIIEAFKDPQAWLISCFMLCICIPNGALSSFSSLIVSGFGFTRLQTLLLQMPTGAFQLIVFLYTSIVSLYFRNFRLVVMIQICLVCILGSSLLYGLDSSHRVGRLVGIYMAGSLAVTFPFCVNLVNTNVAGFTKKATVSAMLFVAYSVGNIIGPQLFLAKEKPEYETGLRGLVIGFVLSLLILFILYFYYVTENRRRDRIAPVTSSDSEMTADDVSNLTDRENLQFRYLL